MASLSEGLDARREILCAYVEQLLRDLSRRRPASCPRWLANLSSHTRFIFRPATELLFQPVGVDVVVSDNCIVDQARKSTPIDEVKGFVALYYLHELHHLSQGIALKSQVRWLTDSGAHEALAEIDLAADHWAAKALASLEWRWSLLSIKGIQSAGLLQFPATSEHTVEARLRKSVRLVSLRTDYLLRRDGRFSRSNWRGHLQVRFGGVLPGSFVLLRIADSPIVLGHTPLLAGELQLLSNCAMQGASSSIDDLDLVLSACLDRLTYAMDDVA